MSSVATRGWVHSQYRMHLGALRTWVHYRMNPGALQLLQQMHLVAFAIENTQIPEPTNPIPRTSPAPVPPAPLTSIPPAPPPPPPGPAAGSRQAPRAPAPRASPLTRRAPPGVTWRAPGGPSAAWGPFPICSSSRSARSGWASHRNSGHRVSPSSAGRVTHSSRHAWGGKGLDILKI